MLDALLATDAWNYLEAHPDAVLVDVRTQAEWLYVGVPDLTPLGRKPVLIEWNRMGGSHNDAFIDDLKAMVSTDRTLLMLCRSGARSLAAGTAARAAGYGTVINISDGFEGDLDDCGRRNSVNGWRHGQLPWHQS